MKILKQSKFNNGWIILFFGVFLANPTSTWAAKDKKDKKKRKDSAPVVQLSEEEYVALTRKVKVLQRLIMSSFLDSKYPEANRFISELLTIVPQVPQYQAHHIIMLRFMSAWCFIEEGRFEQGRIILNEIRHPKLPTSAINTMYGRIAMKEGRFREAVDYLRKGAEFDGYLEGLCTISTMRGNTLMDLAFALETLGSPEAEKYYLASLKAGNQAAGPKLAKYYLLSERLDLAQKIMKDVSLTDYPEAVSLQAGLFYAQEKFDEGMKFFDSLKVNHPEMLHDPTVQILRARVLTELKEYQEAEKVLLDVVREYPDGYSALIFLADIYAEQGKKEKAKLTLLALAKGPDAMELQQHVAPRLFQLGLEDEAMELVREAATTACTPYGLYQTGAYHFKKKDYKQAEFFLELALEKGIARAKEPLAVSKQKLDKVDEAIKLFKSLLEVPANRSISNLQNMMELLSLKNSDDAESVAAESAIYEEWYEEKIRIRLGHRQVQPNLVSNDPARTRARDRMNLKKECALTKKVKEKTRKEVDQTLFPDLNQLDLDGADAPGAVAADETNESEVVLSAEEILNETSKQYETFTKFFLPLTGEYRIESIKIGRDEAEDLIQKLGGETTSGKGRHRKLTFAAGGTPGGMEERSLLEPETMYVLSSSWLKPYQIHGLRKIFLDRKLYPKNMEDLLVRKGLL